MLVDIACPQLVGWLVGATLVKQEVARPKNFSLWPHIRGDNRSIAALISEISQFLTKMVSFVEYLDFY